MKIKVWSESDHSAVPQGIMGKLRFCKKKKKKSLYAVKPVLRGHDLWDKEKVVF
jgi:hypothetical protein